MGRKSERGGEVVKYVYSVDDPYLLTTPSYGFKIVYLSSKFISSFNPLIAYRRYWSNA